MKIRIPNALYARLAAASKLFDGGVSEFARRAFRRCERETTASPWTARVADLYETAMPCREATVATLVGLEEFPDAANHAYVRAVLLAAVEVYESRHCEVFTPPAGIAYVVEQDEEDEEQEG